MDNNPGNYITDKSSTTDYSCKIKLGKKFSNDYFSCFNCGYSCCNRLFDLLVKLKKQLTIKFKVMLGPTIPAVANNNPYSIGLSNKSKGHSDSAINSDTTVANQNLGNLDSDLNNVDQSF